MGEQDQLEDGPSVFSYSDEDVTASLHRMVTDTRAQSISKFDSMLCSRWDKAMTSGGVFRYDLSEINTRIVPGKYGFVAQRNPKRFSHRRKPMDMASLTQPFNAELFHFNKIRKEEILFEVQKQSATNGEIRDRSGHIMVVNVSPIDYGHVLLVPEPRSCLPQVMTKESLQLCLEMLALSGHSGLCMVANSLLAYASVNHLHYHFMYIAQPLLAARVSGRPLTKYSYELVGHPSLGFGFELSTSTDECAKNIFKVISLLLQSDMPHNVVMLWGNPFNKTQSDADGRNEVIRTLIIPRKPAFGLKTLYENEDIPPFFAAACELGLGFIPVVDQMKYEMLSEDDILRILGSKSLSLDEFHPLRTKVIEVFDR